ncbi:monovalent cation/H+ antiporter subunit D [Phyllobacterium leguminum]|uniref:Multisubunit potassium/proton antiporter PhaD subunit n=1 Tax=Phyllobacterium leguminum TaxID=314237 RepID=A0A318T7H2_9HYPH|nr:monovalent cation/H+ antiporter subunit D [Phyllobacterium leguminum]PYE90513.1 multisubunit potassium/proton antiporter PhaD subunit [Phyllobacterium leguminum]
MTAPWLHNLIIAPIVLPFVAGALMLLFDERRHTLKAVTSLASAILLLGVAVALLVLAGAVAPAASVYLLGNWPAPFGIVLVLDRLSALMLVLTAILAIASLVFALARWHRAGPHFHTIFQFLLVGLNGAFLTGDLFNLFVFFEVMLAASYGLVLHGSGPRRVRAGLHYIAFNLAASALFLIGVSLLYGITGTLNMADLARQLPLVAPGDRVFVEAGAAILGVAFLVKAGMWPLGFWLVPAYAAAAAPVAAMFAILSKVGIYLLLRLSLLLSGAGAFAGFGGGWLIAGGMATLAFGLIGVLASQAMDRLAGYFVLVSSGTLIAAIGIGGTQTTGAALYYMASSTFAVAAFFLLAELIGRSQDTAANMLAVTMELYGEDDEEAIEEEVGLAIPATLAILGACFSICAIVLIGMPPFSGFVAKFLLIASILNPKGLGHPLPVSGSAWALIALIAIAGLAALIALTRMGIRIFWASPDGDVPRVLLVEIAPVAGLLMLCLALMAGAGPMMAYMQETAQSLHAPRDYIGSVMDAARVKDAGP